MPHHYPSSPTSARRNQHAFLKGLIAGLIVFYLFNFQINYLSYKIDGALEKDNLQTPPSISDTFPINKQQQQQIVEDTNNGDSSGKNPAETVRENTPSIDTTSQIIHHYNGTCDPRIWTDSARKMKNQKTFARKHLYDTCKFTPIEDGGPTPVIFLVNGRSGSDATWNALSTLAGGKTPLGEHTGPNKVLAMEFLNTTLTSVEEGSWWVEQHLCEFTQRFCDKPLVAFKWKPFVDSWVLPAAQGMLKKLASFDSPRIRVLFMTRNHIDVMISKLKHHNSQHKSHATAHCRQDDEECLKIHAENGRGLILPTDDLVQELTENDEAFALFENTMKDMGILYYRTSYEKLYDSNDAEEWMRIFKFLGKGPMQDLTLDTVFESMQYVRTSSLTHNESLANYEDVRETLKGSKFEDLLHQQLP